MADSLPHRPSTAQGFVPSRADTKAGRQLPASLLLGALLAINPPIVFLATRVWWAAVLAPLTALIIVLVAYRRFGWRLPTAYAINGVWLVGLFLYAEAVFTHGFSDYIVEDLYDLRRGYYFNKPNLTSRFDGKEFSVSYLTNDDGFRIGYSQYTDVTYRSVDWIFIGDSFTQAAQVEFEDLFTTLLYRRFPDRTIANLGVSGFGLPQELALYRDMGVALDPDVVFLQISPFNDFMNVQESRVGVSEMLAHRSNFARFVLQDFLYQNPAELPLGRWTEPFYPTVEGNRDFNVFYRESSARKDADLAAFARYFAEFAEAVRADGRELVVLLLPTKEQIRPHYLLEVVDAFDLPLEQLDLEAPQRLVEHLADSLEVRVIDLWGVFESSPEDPYFVYDEHLSRAGHQIIADAIAATLGTHQGGPTMVSTEFAGDRYPVVVGDSVLYFQSPAGGSIELFRSGLELQELERLTVNDVDELHPAVSPGGDELAFTEGNQESGMTEVVLSDRDGLVRQVITLGEDEFGAIPNFDPTGRRLAFAGWGRDGAGEFTNPRIMIRDLENGTTALLTDGSNEAWRPVFSPDGSKLALIHRRSGQFDVQVVDLVTNEVQWITDTPYDEWDPSFAPDGRSVIYSARRDMNWDLFLYALDSGETERLTASKGDEWDPVIVHLAEGRVAYYAGEFGIFRGIYRMLLN